MKGISGNKGIHKLNNFYIQMRPKKRRKPYLRYLWLNLNKLKTERKTVYKHNIDYFFFKSHSRSDDSQHYFFK
jgi:hypothetical protein